LAEFCTAFQQKSSIVRKPTRKKPNNINILAVIAAIIKLSPVNLI
jgi:hypothetical protein